MNIGERIRAERKKKRISQKELAERAGISNTYLSDIEVGRTDPSLKTLEKISRAMGISMKELL